MKNFIKNVKCDICGREELFKSGEFYVCQNCDMKYLKDLIEENIKKAEAEAAAKAAEDKAINKTDVSDDERRSMRRKTILLRVMLAFSIIAVIVCGAGLGRELYIDWQSQSYYADLSADIEVSPRVPGYRPKPVPLPELPTLPDGSVDPEVDLSLYFTEEDQYSYYDYIYQWKPYMDFEALDRRFPGSVAWIKLEDTLIDYPIMKGRNNDYYLSRLPDGSSHRSGSIFMDFRNNEDFSDKHTLIYGHESRTKDMFGSLKDYRNQDYYNANPSLYIYTPETDYELVLIAAYTLDSGIEVPPMSFRNEADFESHINNIKRRSFFKSSVEVGPDDRIVSLCTCAYDYTNARLIVVGKLVEF